MKKLLSLILILAMMPVIALGELPDLSRLSDADLAELNKHIQSEIFSRSIVSGVEIPKGVYTIGTDIPAGSYRIHSNDNYASIITISTSYEDFKNVVIWDSIIITGEGSEVAKFTFEEGWVIDLSGNITLYPYTGLFH